MGDMRTVRENKSNSLTEDANKLQFGSKLSKAEPLFYAEVTLLLELRLKNFHSYNVENHLLQSTLQYCQRLEPVKSQELVLAMRDLLQSMDPPMQSFEQVQMANLRPDGPEEAFSLIPSLAGRYSHDAIHDLIRRMNTLTL